MMLTGTIPGLDSCSSQKVNAMAVGLLGLKVGMTQVYDEAGKIAPVTVLQVGPCPILLVRNQERDGYDAVQVGFLDKARRKATRAERGHVSAALESRRRQGRAKAGVQLPPKADCEPQRHIREFRLEEPGDYQVGTVLKAADVFKDVPAVDVTGTSKGRGTTGAMKRHNFAGLPASHGVKKHHRRPAASARTPAIAAAAGPNAASAWPAGTAPSASPSATCASSASTPTTTSSSSRGPCPVPTAG